MKSIARIRNRQGRCYKLALLIMLREAEADRFALVHGRVRQELVPGAVHIGHAWVELDGGKTIYDPVEDRYFPAREYVARRCAIVERRYTKAETLQALCASGPGLKMHAGPWHDETAPA
jgi:hypothetical protein